MSINITVNDKSLSCTANTLKGLVEELSINSDNIAIELNGVVVAKSTYDVVAIKEGDVLEVIHFIGGG